jgi:hypothetical protein
VFVDDTDEELAVEEDVRDAGDVLLRPVDPLPADTQIRVESDQTYFVFETGNGEAEPVTTAPTLLIDETVNDVVPLTSCGPSRAVLLMATHEDAAWIELEVTEGEEQVVFGSADGFFFVGENGCTHNFDIGSFAGLSFRARGVSANGEPGPFGETVSPGCGCGTGAQPGVMAIFAAIVLIRRASSRKHGE